MQSSKSSSGGTSGDTTPRPCSPSTTTGGAGGVDDPRAGVHQRGGQAAHQQNYHVHQQQQKQNMPPTTPKRSYLDLLLGRKITLTTLVAIIFIFQIQTSFLLNPLSAQGIISSTTSKTVYSISSTTNPGDRVVSVPRRLAVAMFVDKHEHLYGVYSVKNQLTKFHMIPTPASLVALVSKSSFEQNYIDVLDEWLGEKNVILVDKSYIHEQIVDEGIWKGTFNKLWVFNLTQYDKIVMLDHDILVRTNILHWFDYPAPCATQEQHNLAWNSGAMVIEPDGAIFDKMIRLLPNITRFNPNQNYTTDPLIMGYSDQDFFTSFFIKSNDTGKNHDQQQQQKEATKTRCVMPSESSVLSSKLSFHMEYFLRFRNAKIQTVHFTVYKPMRAKSKRTKDPYACDMLREWNESMRGVERYLNPIRYDYLAECPPPRSIRI